MLQKPRLQNTFINFTEGTTLEVAGCGGLLSLTIYASREGHKERNHTITRKLLMPQGLASSWESRPPDEREGKSLWSLCAYNPVHARKGHSREHQLSAPGQSLAHVKWFPFHLYSDLFSSL